MTCPHCQNSDQSMLEVLTSGRRGADIIFKGLMVVLCHVCTKTFEIERKAKL